MGNLTVWKDFNGGRNYVIGVDTASGQARDYSVASVLDIKSMEYVARLRGKINTDMFAEQLIELGKRYNGATIAVERAGHGHSVLKVLLSRDYPEIYYHADYDEIQGMNVDDAGWKTSGKTKPLMVNGMIQAFRSQDLISWSENLLMEASALVWEGGIDSKVKTVAGGNDDEWDAVSIAIQVRESLPVSAVQEVSFGHFGRDKYDTESRWGFVKYFHGSDDDPGFDIMREGWWLKTSEVWEPDNIYRKTDWTFTPEYHVPYFDVVNLLL